MRRFRAHFYLLLAALGFTQVLWGAAPLPIRILPLGDSITSGFGPAVEGGYRTELYTKLINAGSAVDVVGALENANPPVALSDTDHEGQGGFRIDEIDAKFEGWFPLRFHKLF